MSFQVTVTPIIQDVEVSASTQPFEVEVNALNGQQLELTTDGTSGEATFDPFSGVLNIPVYTFDPSGYVPTSRQLSINGVGFDLSSNRSWTIPTHDPVTLGTANGLSLVGQILSLGLASNGITGALSGTDWATFNGKEPAISAGTTAQYFRGDKTFQTLNPSAVGASTVGGNIFTSANPSAITFLRANSNNTVDWLTAAAFRTAIGAQATLTNPITGTGVSGQVAFWNGTSSQTGSNNLFWDNVNSRLGIGIAVPLATFHQVGLSIIQGTTASDTAPLGSELTTTGTGANWTGTGFATGYTHTIGLTDPLVTTLAAVIGTYYQIAYTITGRTTGSITINYGGSSTAGITATGATGPLASTTAVLSITPTTDFNGTLVLSVRTIGTSSANTSFRDSSGNSRIEVRATTAASNTLIGVGAGRRITTGINNSFFGTQSGFNTTTGSSNSFYGLNSGVNNITGVNNSCFGLQSGFSITIGNDNSFFGRESGFNITTGSFNSFFGRSAGRFLEDGTTSLTLANNSVFLGVDTRSGGNNQTNQIVIGHTAIGEGSNTTVIGNSSTTATRLFGTLRVGTINNATGNFLTTSATGVIQQRTANQVILELLPTISGYNAGVNQVLRNNSGTLTWVNI